MPLLAFASSSPVGNFWFAYSDNRGAVWTEIDSGILARTCCVRVDRAVKDSPVFAWLQTDADAIVRYRSDNEGKTWTMATTISSGGTNTTPACIIGRNGWQYQYWIKADGAGGFDLKVQIRDRADNIVAAEQVAAGVGKVDDEGCAADEFVAGGGEHKLRIWVIKGGALTAYVGVDGLNFS